MLRREMRNFRESRELRDRISEGDLVAWILVE